MFWNAGKGTYSFSSFVHSSLSSYLFLSSQAYVMNICMHIAVYVY